MPNGDHIKVSFAAVEQAGVNITSTFNKMTQELDDLKSRLAPLAEAYQGQARDAWNQVQTDWNKNQDELNQVLSSIGTAVSQAAQDYRDTEGGVSRMWQ
ncbi:WXG100 family type VII secretion target [Actinocrispum wychmicini]|uniref:ESAT-6-like protein n=1 Tax=Actinocrispum wychmicini TaxID=1213861 RepID=A0A4R2K151_9PSEU|nr:WXG100 family type VII secretion target [Actinocrispum wychmicini]TCO65382.1 WXG100 family type VII secretion target [Actinocrispum wychmicini]